MKIRRQKRLLVDKQPSRSHITHNQKEQLVSFIEKNPDLKTGKFHATFTQHDARRLWQQMSKELNGAPGPCKSWKSWRKTWQDMKGDIKAKMIGLGKYSGTKGDSYTYVLSKHEERIKNMIVNTPYLHERKRAKVSKELSNKRNTEEFETSEKLNTIKTDSTNPPPNLDSLEQVDENLSISDLQSSISNPLGKLPNITVHEKASKRKVDKIQKNSSVKRLEANIIKRLKRQDAFHAKSVELEERKVSAKERMASAHESIAASLLDLVDYFKNVN